MQKEESESERGEKERGGTARHVVIAAPRKRNIGCGKNGSNESTANFLRRSDSPSKYVPLRIERDAFIRICLDVSREREIERICCIFYTIRVDRLFIPLSREDRKKGKTIESSSLD